MTLSQCVVAEIPDSDSEFNRALAQAQGVSSYPTIKFYPRDGSSPIPYSGARNEEGFVNVSPL
jgi:protein disulfide-isomerase A6